MNEIDISHMAQTDMNDLHEMIVACCIKDARDSKQRSPKANDLYMALISFLAEEQVDHINREFKRANLGRQFTVQEVIDIYMKREGLE